MILLLFTYDIYKNFGTIIILTKLFIRTKKGNFESLFYKCISLILLIK